MLVTHFDPLRIISPISVTGKIQFQDLLMQKLGWDDHIFQGKVIEWGSWLDDLEMAKSLSLPMCLWDFRKISHFFEQRNKFQQNN